MNKAISNTSPMLYLYRIGGIDWLPLLFNEVLIPEEVTRELEAGRAKGYDVPNPEDYPWLTIIKSKSMPSEWLVSDFGSGEIAVMTLAFENPEYVILLDDMLARRTAQAAGLKVWGTLRVLIEAKAERLIDRIEPYISGLNSAGMWISPEVKSRILTLAGEKGGMKG